MDPAGQPVVAAVVTSDLGVLVGRRRDGTPPWTLITGKIEHGESPADAAVREVMEETCLAVEANEHLGQRVHPQTNRLIVYVACTPVRGIEVAVGAPKELEEVRWLGIEDVSERLPGLFAPVHEHLLQAPRSLTRPPP